MCGEGLEAKFGGCCGLEVIANMAVRDGEYCFSCFMRFIDKFTDFNWMSLVSCMIIWYSIMLGMY